ncbi:hypothetical protein A9Q73_09470 [Bermanella sp. 47_1433_sub80_T6]|nr:hypothetical protein A9Q73_09470 [Bermanella sp. 47_1433_sub80_T6]
MTPKTLLKLSCASMAFLTLMACSKEEVANQVTEAPLKPVRTMTVSLGSVSEKSFTGVVDAVKTAELGFRVSGELTSVKSKEGDFVEKGQVLATLDQTDFKIALDANQAEFDRASAEFKRAQSLITQGAISTADFEKLKAQKSNATAQLNSAKQNLKYTVLKAPFKGVIAKQYLSNFEKISSSMSFAIIQDISAFEVKINIPESVMIKLKRDEEDRPVYAVFDGNQDKHYPLAFKEVSTRADEKTQTYAVKFVMDEPKDINLLPGMSARVYAELNIHDKSIKEIFVPAHSVLEDSQGRFVYVVNDASETQGEIERRAVVVGELNENGILILQGLDVGDRVVTAGMSKMSPGLMVRLMAEG